MTDNLVGKLLVAMPGIGDPRFEHSVVLMCAHDADHAMGVVINKPKHDVALSDVLEHLGLELDGEDAGRMVFDGGPVRPDRGYVLHSEDFAAGEATMEVAPGIRLTATRDVLVAVAGHEAPERFLLALGCAGWGAGQLENELRHNAWVVVDPDNAIVFDELHTEKWARALKTLGFDPGQLMSGDAGRA